MEDKKKLFVGNLPYKVRSTELNQMFAQFGTVVEAIVIEERQTGRSKGFGFVTFSTEEEAQAAVSAMNGHEVEGRALVVNVARPKEQN